VAGGGIGENRLVPERGKKKQKIRRGQGISWGRVPLSESDLLYSCQSGDGVTLERKRMGKEARAYHVTGSQGTGERRITEEKKGKVGGRRCI